MYVLCIVAFIFIGASLYTLFGCDHCKNYKANLNEEQLIIYHKISQERRNIAVQGLILGLFLAFIFMYLTHKTFNPLACGCSFAAVVLFVQYLYYMLYPKSDYMILHIDGEQKEEWLEVYKEMQYRYHIGMVLGIIGYFILAYFIKLIL